jgi:hypothetical protein
MSCRYRADLGTYGTKTNKITTTKYCCLELFGKLQHIKKLYIPPYKFAVFCDIKIPFNIIFSMKYMLYDEFEVENRLEKFEFCKLSHAVDCKFTKELNLRIIL